MSVTRRLLAVLPLAVSLSGCVFVGQGAYDDKLETIDEDSDGALYADADAEKRDCDDEDPTRSTLIVENQCEAVLGRPVEPTDDCVKLAYNGNDDDCGGSDWVDIDGDGIPSMLQAAYEAQDGNPAWPSGTGDPLPVTEAAEVDCDDFDAAIFPLNPSDPFYDGVDSDCAGNDDFDQDADGHRRIPEGDDCDDQDANAFPGNPAEDVWYDGIDSDCAGNNDFDQDGDGYMPDEAEVDGVIVAVPGKFDTYTEKYDYDFPAEFGDCLDADPPAASDPPAGLDPADVYPTASDDFYDGIDSDCAGDNDFDADVDGYMPNGVASDFEAFVDFWGYDFPDDANDCDDRDAAIHPGEFELVGDVDDQDCDGELDGSLFDTQDFGWDEPHSIYVGRTDEYYTISTTAEFQDRITATNTRTGLTLYFDAVATLAAEEAHPTPDIPTPWWPVGTIGAAIPPIGSGFGAAYNADSLYVGFSVDYTSGSTEKGYMIMRRGTYSETSGSVSYQTAQSGGSSSVVEPYNDIDLRPDADGYVWEWGCGDDTAGLMVAKDHSSDTRLIRKGDTTFTGTGLNADTAVVFPGVAGSLAATGLCCEDGSCKSFSLTHGDLGGDTTTTDASITLNGAASQKYLSANSNNDWIAVAQSPQPGVLLLNADGTSYTVLKTKTVTEAAVSVDGGKFFVLAATSGTDLVFAYGAPTALTESTIPFSDGTGSWVAKHVGIYADADRIVLAAASSDGTAMSTGTSGAVDGDDHVGWVFLGRAGDL